MREVWKFVKKVLGYKLAYRDEQRFRWMTFEPDQLNGDTLYIQREKSGNFFRLITVKADGNSEVSETYEIFQKIQETKKERKT
jgi:hypothetical protein